MNFLEEKILSDGVIKEGNILKVDNYLNHQIDIDIMRQVAYEFNASRPTASSAEASPATVSSAR